MTSESGQGAPAGRVEYVSELDSIRLLAILSVFCSHWLPGSHWINRLEGNTAWGVYLFFVLSGLLITRILMRCRENVLHGITSTGYSLRQFYCRRFLRIFPLYYLLLLIGVLLNVQGVRQSIGWQVLYLTNHYFFLHHAFIGPTTPFWSLSVEEQFYLAWPVLMLTLPERALTPFVMLTFAVGTVCRCHASFSVNPLYRILTPSCMGYLSAGALVAVAESPLTRWPRRASLLRFYLLAGSVVAAIALVLHLGPDFRHREECVDSACHVAASLLFGWFVAIAATGFTGAIGRVFRFAPAVYLGKISYGLYAYHSFIRWTLAWVGPRLAHHLAWPAATGVVDSFPVRLVATIGVASVSWHLFEKPLNDLKRYFPYSGRPRPLMLEERGIPIPPAAELSEPAPC